MKKNILIFIGSYLPGTKSAGVTTSMKNLIDNLYHNFNFYIITADRDIGESEPYDSVEIDKWTKYGNCNVFYSSKYTKSFKELKKIINSVDVDMYYFNGFYNYVDIARVLPLYSFKLIKKKPIVIAPRGIFSMGEYKNKEIFRKIYRCLFKLAGFDKIVCWHATGEKEKVDISKYFTIEDKNIGVIPNLSKSFTPYLNKAIKNVDELKIIFISRISEKKNIKFIIDTLKNVSGHVVVDIYGMIGTELDRKYWQKCEENILKLPTNIKVNYLGEVGADSVGDVFKKYNLFYFPTFGENYGHVIAESISNGCPVLLSNTTPWNNLEEYNAGWVYDLCERERYVEKLNQLVRMNNDEWNKFSLGAYEAAKHLINNDELISKYNDFFQNI